jgi:hypothetical protein
VVVHSKSPQTNPHNEWMDATMNINDVLSTMVDIGNDSQQQLKIGLCMDCTHNQQQILFEYSFHEYSTWMCFTHMMDELGMVELT